MFPLDLRLVLSGGGFGGRGRNAGAISHHLRRHPGGALRPGQAGDRAISFITSRAGFTRIEFSPRLLPGFVLQAGGFVVTNRGTTNWSTVPVATYPPITDEFDTGKFLQQCVRDHRHGQTSDPNSATSQFFFNLADNSASLDNPTNSGGFTVFGHVVAGTNVLGTFNNCQYWSYPWTNTPQPTNLVLNQYYNPPFDTLPLLNPSITDSNLV